MATGRSAPRRSVTGFAERSATPLSGQQRLLATGLVLGVTLVAFETTAAITALPTIADELGGDSLYGVALASYTLANLVALVAGGRYADRRGPTPTFLVAIATFTVGLLVSGSAPTMAVVVLGRTLQGAGAGGFAPIAYVLVRRAFPDDRQPMMYALLSAGWVLPSLIAPAFGGLLTQHVGWRWVFYSIVPLAVTVGIVGSIPMRQYGPATEATAADRTRIPLAFAAAFGSGAVVVGLRSASPTTMGLSIVGGGVLAVVALRALLPPGTLGARPGLGAIVACRFLATATFMGVDGFVPLAADRVHGAPPTIQGFVIVGAALAWTAGQAISAQRPDVAPARAVRGGFVLLLVGVLAVSPVLWHGWPLWATFLSWGIGGLGIGVLFNPTTVEAMGWAMDGNEGDVSSQVQLADALGFSLMGGIGGAAVAFADRGSVHLETALAVNFAIAATLALIGMVISRGVHGAGHVTARSATAQASAT